MLLAEERDQCEKAAFMLQRFFKKQLLKRSKQKQNNKKGPVMTISSTTRKKSSARKASTTNQQALMLSDIVAFSHLSHDDKVLQTLRQLLSGLAVNKVRETRFLRDQVIILSLNADGTQLEYAGRKGPRTIALTSIVNIDRVLPPKKSNENNTFFRLGVQASDRSKLLLLSFETETELQIMQEALCRLFDVIQERKKKGVYVDSYGSVRKIAPNVKSIYRQVESLSDPRTQY